jgi:hypothetical protein
LVGGLIDLQEHREPVPHEGSSDGDIEAGPEPIIGISAAA